MPHPIEYLMPELKALLATGQALSARLLAKATNDNQLERAWLTRANDLLSGAIRMYELTKANMIQHPNDPTGAPINFANRVKDNAYQLALARAVSYVAQAHAREVAR